MPSGEGDNFFLLGIAAGGFARRNADMKRGRIAFGVENVFSLITGIPENVQEAGFGVEGVGLGYKLARELCVRAKPEYCVASLDIALVLHQGLALAVREGFVENRARLRVTLGYNIPAGIDGNGNAPLFDNFKRFVGFAGLGLRRVRFPANIAPSLSRLVKQTRKHRIKYGGGGGS